MVAQQCEYTKCHWIVHFQMAIIYYVNFTSIREKMKGQNCNIIIMVYDDLHTLQILDEVNIKKITSILA